jgi:hypothetical protein
MNLQVQRQQEVSNKLSLEREKLADQKNKWNKKK